MVSLVNVYLGAVYLCFQRISAQTRKLPTDEEQHVRISRFWQGIY